MARHDTMLKAFTDRPILLDGGKGRELQFRGVQLSRQIWSASALTEAPDRVRTVHEDYIRAGADIITTNTYGLIREDLARAGLEDRYEDLNTIAGRLAREACAIADRPVLVAGSLPPLRGSFRPDRVGPASKLIPFYREQARLLTPFVDFFLCETMSSAAEGRAAAEGALEAGKPVWVSWTLHEDHFVRFRLAVDSVVRHRNAASALPFHRFAGIEVQVQLRECETYPFLIEPQFGLLQ